MSHIHGYLWAWQVWQIQQMEEILLMVPTSFVKEKKEAPFFGKETREWNISYFSDSASWIERDSELEKLKLKTDLSEWPYIVQVM